MFTPFQVKEQHAKFILRYLKGGERLFIIPEHTHTHTHIIFIYFSSYEFSIKKCVRRKVPNHLQMQ